MDWIPQKPAQIYHFHTHINGAPEEMTDAQGQVAWQGRYAAWGNLALESYPLEAPDPKGLGLQLLPQNLRLQGQYADTESGLHYNTFRYYDPDIGRFTTPDPIGLAGGINLYRFAPNPSSWIDPWGWVSAPADLPNTAGVYIIRNGNDAYVGSAGGGTQGMADRVSDTRHQSAQELLKKPGTTVHYQEVDLGTASTRSEREHILRHFEQQEMNRLRREKVNLSNKRNAEAGNKTHRNLAEIRKHGAKVGNPTRCIG